MKVPDLGLLVAGEDDLLERTGLQAGLQLGQVVDVLVEHPGEQAQLVGLGRQPFDPTRGHSASVRSV